MKKMRVALGCLFLMLFNNIIIENTDIATPTGVKHYDNEVFNA